jgi:hypothetical protein
LQAALSPPVALASLLSDLPARNGDQW